MSQYNSASLWTAFNLCYQGLVYGTKQEEGAVLLGFRVSGKQQVVDGMVDEKKKGISIMLILCSQSKDMRNH